MAKLKGLNRLGLLVLAGGFLVGSCVFYIQFFMTRPVGSGPAGPSVSSDAFAEQWSDRKVHLLGIGDSITAGLGAKSPEHSYFQRLLKNPADEFEDMRGKCLTQVLPDLSYKNLGISGTTSLQHKDVLDSLEPFPEDVFGLVVMTTGGNDLIHNYGYSPPREGAMYLATREQAEPWIENFRQRLSGMLDRLGTLFPGGCEIFLADIYDPTDGVGDAASIWLKPWPDGLEIHAAYNQIIHDACRQRNNTHLVELYANFLGHGSHCRQFWRASYDSEDPYYWFYDNVEDPNDRGYDAIRRVFLNSIIRNSQLIGML